MIHELFAIPHHNIFTIEKFIEIYYYENYIRT
jgi:hypothetical protein